MVRRESLLRLESVHITREHGCLADVVQAEQLHGQTLEADAQTAVRRHTVLVQHGEGLEQLGVHLACCKLVHLLLIIVDTLAAGGDLQTAERLLLEVPQKNGEWYFLSGSIAYRKGWLDEAMQNYSMAVQMEPNNMEYRQALSIMQRGNVGYRPYGYTNTVDGMDCCTSMLCLNCLCGGGHC